ncbi:MAG: hypothetical protein ACLSA2_01225 [Candidatus Gastranaerophilaceae bacterium]
MNYKKLLIASFVVMAALSSQVYAKELQAQVQKIPLMLRNLLHRQLKQVLRHILKLQDLSNTIIAQKQMQKSKNS